VKADPESVGPEKGAADELSSNNASVPGSPLRAGGALTAPTSRTTPRDDGIGLSFDEIFQWGRLASLIVMLLALFAFGLNYDPDTKDISINWPELPAILIVVILAELGISLIGIAQQVHDSVQGATKSISDTAKEAKAAGQGLDGAVAALRKAETQTTAAFEHLETKTKAAFEQLEPEIKKLSGLTASALWISVKTSASKLEMTEEQVFDSLDRFFMAWLASESEAGAALQGSLFKAFIGNELGSGSVWKEQGSVHCIASDHVYVEACNAWLDKIARSVANNDERELVVWAITTLLPTEFAFPAAYRGASDQDVQRVRAFEMFISSVMKTCRNTAVGEYLRVTVLDEQEFRELNGAGNVSEESITLKNWYILDKRMLQTGVSDSAGDVYRLQRKSKLIAEKSGDAYDQRFTMTRGSLADAFGYDREHVSRLQLFPYRSTRPSKLFDFTTEDAAAGLHVFGANSGYWADELIAEQLAGRGLPPDDVQWMKGRRASEVLRELGWNSVLEWYTTGMHRPRRNGQQAAWWSVVENKHARIFDALSLEWGGTKVHTHDLLLLGTRPKVGDHDPKWAGAVTSNLTADHTECTIRLVTDRGHLEAIEDVVKKLCGNFRAKPAPDAVDATVSSYGCWNDWPIPAWERPRDERPHS
jgi:hypothetical protein